MLKYNPIINSDSYKMSHWYMYPEGTTNVYSYLESRGGRYDSTLFFGLQGFLKEYLSKPVTWANVREAAQFAYFHGVPFNKDGWMRIIEDHGGYFPVEIKAVPEGSLIPNKNVLMTVENTDPAVPFITSYIETMALRLWYPITVATRSYYMKKKLHPYFMASSDSCNMDFALHDFSARGCSSYESNMAGGAAHLVNFMGSDSMAAIDYVRQLYGDGSYENVVGYSVPATEHSIMCAYGKENEFESFKRLVDLAKPNSALSVVSDTWNIFEACKMWASLKDEIIAKNITLVVRPDSGEIREVLPQVLQILQDGFGYTENACTAKVLNNVKVLWGDGMNENTIDEPFAVAMMMGISADSIITGSGGGLMQADIDRDTNKFAFKASNITINGVDHPIAKDPITDPGKQSKKGRLHLSKGTVDGESHYMTLENCQSEIYDNNNDILRPVFRNGELLIDEDMKTIRNRVNLQQ